MKKVILLLVLSFILTGCNIFEEDNNDTDIIERKKTEKILKEIHNQIGMPNIKHFQQKKVMKMIYEETDREDLICYAYITAKYTGKLIFIGKCIGYGVPFSAQYTSPQKVKEMSFMSGYKIITLPQADPNGLYMPTSSSATWLMLIDPKTGKPRPVYIEPEIIVSPFPLDYINK